ncbi:MAG: hypothetical protein M3R15_13875 [Acidobacteriota bacterium]|nr:hypothetical protein [Acidobacteriota bacterium]
MTQHDPKQAHHDGTAAMHRRRIPLDDGRYMIFYTFDGTTAPLNTSESASPLQPDAKPVVEEERRV